MEHTLNPFLDGKGGSLGCISTVKCFRLSKISNENYFEIFRILFIFSPSVQGVNMEVLSSKCYIYSKHTLRKWGNDLVMNFGSQ